jgi:hypothetical protein
MALMSEKRAYRFTMTNREQDGFGTSQLRSTGCPDLLRRARYVVSEEGLEPQVHATPGKRGSPPPDIHHGDELPLPSCGEEITTNPMLGLKETRDHCSTAR